MSTRQQPQRRSSELTLAKLRQAAVELYNDPQIGRDRLSMVLVSERAGVSIGTVYRYWESRLQMLDDIAPYRPRF